MSGFGTLLKQYLEIYKISQGNSCIKCKLVVKYQKAINKNYNNFNWGVGNDKSID